MERVMVEIFLPAVGKKFDVRLPLDLNVGVLTGMIAKALSELSEGRYLPSETSCLALQGSGQPLDNMKTMRQCGVRNTSKLLMI